ncbi:MAG: class I fructose-bisphosphate aldolase family protein [Nitrosopumilus sp.]|nr:class I fructose-bisphosphate aldolase family protein [Nitrosopumilus sp.]CAI9832709.1 2-amino-3,7-dideoxy-D-threo-hept-6-ulosonate synthase [Nitrosopumilaceae archaeon]MDA7940695.1 class I fructose-bisphosphate aldolase family protein [Nitrosopumilus sp.]MDA7942903.1 class I fructose-bisphosphate aldolase family protein [Nitrosopumilus sp.]MDA7944686.1 class I fructose-bisphosphate aldolase family protein [Nitrosopumilus sp.]
MVSGSRIRLERILRDGRMLCMPMDHGISGGPSRGLEDPGAVIGQCARNGLNCVILNKGILKALAEPPRASVLVHLSASTSLSQSPDRKVLSGTVDEAAAMGADGISIHVNIGGADEPEMLAQMGEVSSRCSDLGMPLLAMMYPRGANISDPHDPGIVSHVARVGAEFGADIVKVPYTGDAGSFRQVVRGTPVPVVIAGGPKASDESLLEMTRGAIEAGAAGVTYGRNIFGHDDPGGMTRRLAGIIFGGIP